MMLILLPVALLVLQLLDWYTTRTIINRGGYEQNKFMAKLFDEFGMDQVLFIKAVVVTAIGWWIGTQIEWVLGVVIAFYIGVLIHNWKSMP